MLTVPNKFSTNFVGLQCWYEHHDTIYIAMDNHTWGDLNRHIISFGPYEESGAKDIAEQLVQAVLVLHELGIVHRDIKPEVCLAPQSPYLTEPPPRVIVNVLTDQSEHSRRFGFPSTYSTSRLWAGEEFGRTYADWGRHPPRYTGLGLTGAK